MKYLGVILDDELLMDGLEDMKQNYVFLCKSKKLSTQSKIEYCSTVLFLMTSDEQVKRFQRIQNKIMRLILRATNRTYVVGRTGVVAAYETNYCFIYKIINNQLPVQQN
jgi:hypothetical protein